MSREKTVVWGVFIFSLLLWGLDVLMRYQGSDWGVWLFRKEMINLTGIICLVSMGVIMLLALRPTFLEGFFQGLDKIYYVHKWLGIFSIVGVALHYGAKLSKTVLRPFFERGPKLKDLRIEWMEDYRGLAKDIGEVLFYLFMIMLVITLLHKIPYRIWRVIHKLTSLLFLAVVFHTIILSPARYWTEPVGIVFIIFMVIGTYAALISLLGMIGKKRRFSAKVTELKKEADMTIVTCKMDSKWQHEAGQYAFIQHEGSNEKHPFTIASVVHRDHEIRFVIKALGHYTRRIQEEWQIGDRLKIEGPYGRFLFQNSTLPKQIWIAGGVGITPFIAWLESLQGKKLAQEVTLYYCVNREEECLVPEYLEKLAKESGIHLRIHCSDHEGYLKPEALPLDRETSVWFCGPAGFAGKIQQAIQAKGLSLSEHFHREYFNMR